MGRIGLVVVALLCAAVLGVAVRSSSAQPKGPRAHEATLEEKLSVRGIRAAQDELNAQSATLVEHARARLGIPASHRFAWDAASRDAQGNPGVWLSAEPETAPAPVAPVATSG